MSDCAVIIVDFVEAHRDLLNADSMALAAGAFEGKRALVTGAGKGIGRAIAESLYKHGARVVALSRTQDDLDSLKSEFPDMEVVNQDVGDWESTTKVIDSLGYFDYLVNNAGVLIMAPILELKKEDLERVMNINYYATVNISQVVGKKMVAAGKGGSIVNISSISGKIANWNGIGSYAPTKAAMDMLTKVMALELGPHKIRVNSVNPTCVMTKMGSFAAEHPEGQAMLTRTPLQRFAELDDITGPVLFLLSDQSAMITGTTMVVDGGLLCR